MGLRQRAFVHGEKFELTSFTNQSISEDIHRRFFWDKRESWGPHTIPFIPTDLALASIETQSDFYSEFSRFYDVDGNSVLLLETELHQIGQYAHEGRSCIDKLSPDSWGDFTFHFTLPLWKRSKEKIDTLTRSLASRRPKASEAHREWEFDVLHKVMQEVDICELAQSAKKFISGEAELEYTLKAIQAAMERVYPYDSRLRHLQMALLVKAKPDVIMGFAYILSCIENHDVFTTFAIKEKEQNLMPVQWDFPR